MTRPSYDFLIVGAGVIGLSVARALTAARAGSVCVLEKEPEPGRHASGRNSGVIHAGIYYKPGTLKARWCVEGARKLIAYAEEHKIPCKKIGKVLVACDAVGEARMDDIYDRAKDNGVRLEKIDASALKQIEPQARPGRALFSPDTAIIDSKAVLRRLRLDVTEAGGCVEVSAPVRRIDSEARTVETDKQTFSYGHLINAAGLHADRLAHAMGAGEKYRILPFRGTYRQLRPETARRFTRLIYPIPDPEMPFLGVHVTPSLNSHVYIGPTAIPAQGREHYKGVQGISFEAFRIASDLCRKLATSKNGFGRMVVREAMKNHPARFLRAAREIAPGLQAADLLPSDHVGIRAQLVNKRNLEFVMDFVVEDGPSSTHLLNAVSPGFTSSLAFAEWIADRVTMRQAA